MFNCFNAIKDVAVCPGVVVSYISHDIGNSHVVVKETRKKVHFLGQRDVCLLHPFSVGVP